MIAGLNFGLATLLFGTKQNKVVVHLHDKIAIYD